MTKTKRKTGKVRAVAQPIADATALADSDDSRLKEAQRLSWECVETALEITAMRLRAAREDQEAMEWLERRFADGSDKALPLFPSPGEVKALVDAARTLSEKRPRVATSVKDLLEGTY